MAEWHLNVLLLDLEWLFPNVVIIFKEYSLKATHQFYGARVDSHESTLYIP